MLEHLLYLALLHSVTLDNGHPIRHCRAAREGCSTRLQRYAETIASASRTSGVDPWLIAAKTVLSSGLDPQSTAPSTGAFGLIAIHPKDRLAKTCDASTVGMVPTGPWKEKCKRVRFLSPEETILRYSVAIAEWTRECRGLDRAMLRWSTGSCAGAEHPLYHKKATMVLSRADKLRSRAEAMLRAEQTQVIAAKEQT